ncbi:hypothetical protein A3D70_01240 [Candidatus Adlerbacteria bacterium RIFCSPHIGHO2_02_FULL_54_18]|uniref:Transposase IS200-like domain-containing protein n=2 Tax=Candidatus Adleribacteriota TaxID=1752736 RepID=A0A1F4Y6Z8_9BACT|nr:MAG: hypothetical protein A2949_02175 [Candidatus Adlerbacteria bacterium RIFCSPLOWO2_01_FULL_54_21b]OGC89043.1 MAG: hypothetical protein A3D70_01240 [Candidatus Adlerbacteria bacterium RIFCSPHIGHO2_02_FULL_54_18]
MLRDKPFINGETYHLFNRGAHKQTIFTNEEDYCRFLVLLFFSNTKERVQLGNLLQNQGRSLISLLGEDVDQSLVDIFSYTLMPNHFHLVIRQKADDGVSKFMRKLATAYSMYFNIKYDHSGVLFQGRFKSRHIGNEAYFRYIFAYVHLNSLDLFEPGWEEQGLKNLDGARQYVNSYRYSSFFDYVGNDRPEKALLSLSQAPEFLTTQNDLEALLQSFNQGQSLIVDVDRKG